ncbi:hypothetical protein PIB30_046773 [Stylosanthes scabra]|uniref:Uncharacterized protein n=1 Tax=Stylosanthes scabra TaxID=79078 RepID=A0ABU6XFK9_9FABA|nr:hypothetical protein [Stylosanthes scabra]
MVSLLVGIHLSNSKARHDSPYTYSQPQNTQNTRYQPPQIRQQFPPTKNPPYNYDEAIRIYQKGNQEIRETQKRMTPAMLAPLVSLSSNAEFTRIHREISILIVVYAKDMRTRINASNDKAHPELRHAPINVNGKLKRHPSVYVPLRCVCTGAAPVRTMGL